MTKPATAGAGKRRVARPAASPFAPAPLSVELVASPEEALRVVDALGKDDVAVKVARQRSRWLLTVCPSSDLALSHVRAVVAAVEAHVTSPEQARILVAGKAYGLGVRADPRRQERVSAPAADGYEPRS